jgi:hypothetical protein
MLAFLLEWCICWPLEIILFLLRDFNCFFSWVFRVAFSSVVLYKHSLSGSSFTGFVRMVCLRVGLKSFANSCFLWHLAKLFSLTIRLVGLLSPTWSHAVGSL